MAEYRVNLIRRAWNTAMVAALACRERRVPFWPPERIAAVQRKRLPAILRHAYRTVPFYRQAMRDRGLRPEDFRTADDLSKLPLVDDLLVRKHMDQFVSTAWAARARVTLRTSGTLSRVLKMVYWDYPASLRKLAIAERDRSVLNGLLGKGWGQVQAYLLPEASISIELRQFWDACTLTPRGLARRHWLSSAAPYDEAAEFINAVRPEVVFSYGSYAAEFFRWLADKRISVALPRVWAYGGDMMAAAARELAEQTFGCKIYSTYQAVETGRIGFQCQRREAFHLNTDYCAVRLIDEAGRPVPPGEPGRDRGQQPVQPGHGVAQLPHGRRRRSVGRAVPLRSDLAAAGRPAKQGQPDHRPARWPTDQGPDGGVGLQG